MKSSSNTVISTLLAVLSHCAFSGWRDWKARKLRAHSDEERASEVDPTRPDQGGGWMEKQSPCLDDSPFLTLTYFSSFILRSLLCSIHYTATLFHCSCTLSGKSTITRSVSQSVSWSPRTVLGHVQLTFIHHDTAITTTTSPPCPLPSTTPPQPSLLPLKSSSLLQRPTPRCVGSILVFHANDAGLATS